MEDSKVRRDNIAHAEYDLRHIRILSEKIIIISDTTKLNLGIVPLSARPMHLQCQQKCLFLQSVGIRQRHPGKE